MTVGHDEARVDYSGKFRDVGCLLESPVALHLLKHGLRGINPYGNLRALGLALVNSVPDF